MWKNCLLDRQIRMLEKFIEKNKSALKRGQGVNSSFTQKIKEKNQKIHLSVKKLIQVSKQNPKVIIKFIENKNTKVYQTPFAIKLLKHINEEQGFIPPKTGIKALYLNTIIPLICGKKMIFSLQSSEMFVFAPKKLHLYKLIEGVYHWHAFRAKLDGYNEKAIENYKKTQISKNKEYIKRLSFDEIQEVKAVVYRGLEACKFIMNFSIEYDNAKNLTSKTNSVTGASV